MVNAQQHGLGRISAPDERDRLHLMAAHLPDAAAAEPLPTYRYWTPGPVLDQGATSQCVAYATTGWLNATPVRTFDASPPHVIYEQAQSLDGFPLPHDGTTVRAAMQVMAREGRISEYVWATALDDVVRWVLLKGPVVIGTAWYFDMFAPNRYGRVSLTGAYVGGHSTLITGVNSTHRMARVRNSWGSGWGQNGNFWLSFFDLNRLLFTEGGEAATALEKAV